MDFRRGRKHEELEINLVPLIDVLLVIIIFLVVSATFSRINELKINLPTADASPQQEKPLSVTVSVNASGHYSINNTALSERTVSAIANAMHSAVGKSDGREPTIIINADANTTHQSVINVMEAARQAGYPHITFATQVQSGQ